MSQEERDAKAARRYSSHRRRDSDCSSRVHRARKALDPTTPSVVRRQDRPAKTGGFIKQTYSTLVRHISGCRKWHIVAYFSVRKPSHRKLSTEMKLGCRVTIICVYLSSLITNTFEGFVFLMVFSSPERPAPGNWNFPIPQLPMTHPDPGLLQKMIIPGVGLTPTIVKPRSVLQRPPHLVPPLLRSLRVYPCHHLIKPVNTCTRFLV